MLTASLRAAGPISARVAPLALASLALAACGDNNNNIQPESVFAAQCAMPRSGTDPGTGMPYPDVAGTVLDEKQWVQSWINDLYLWYREVPAVDINAYTDPVSYFDQLKTPAKTASGKDKDQFHFIYTTADWEALSGSGIEASYGVQWALIASSPPRSLVVAYTQPGSPAATANLARGAKILTIDGVDVQNGSDINTLNEGINPTQLNEPHTFSVLDLGAVTPRTVMLTSTSVTITPVLSAQMLPAPNDKVGYIHFTDHIATAEKELSDAISLLQAAGTTDLVLDMRYNGGGFLDIASELAFEVAGPTATAGKTFERVTFNDKHPSIDPSTNQPLTPEGFVSSAEGFSLPPGQALPSLGLTRLFVLTSSETCSASEAVMNGLSGIDVQVIQIGETTCGKPYGFYPADNCGTTYFAINFQGVNNKNFGDYADGFVPGGNFKGCVVADDFTHALGDPAEARLAAALAYRSTGSCPPAPAASAARSLDDLAAPPEPVIPKPLWRQNRIARP